MMVMNQLNYKNTDDDPEKDIHLVYTRWLV